MCSASSYQVDVHAKTNRTRDSICDVMIERVVLVVVVDLWVLFAKLQQVNLKLIIAVFIVKLPAFVFKE